MKFAAVQKNLKMNRCNLFLLISLTVFFNSLYGQSIVQNYYLEKTHKTTPPTNYTYHLRWLYPEILKEFNQKDTSEVRKHFLGGDVAVRMHFLESAYVIKTKPAPGAFSEKITVLKPVIYHSIHKIERYCKNQVKNGSVPFEIACRIMIDCTEKAILIANEDTKTLEDELLRAEAPEDIIGIFMRIQII